jgi:hypothetical protein
MTADRDEIRRVEPSAHLLNRMPVKLEELDAVVTLSTHGVQGVLEIAIARVANRPELKRYARHVLKSRLSMASYTVNKHAVAHAKRLIDAHQYVVRSVWNEVQPSASAENAFLESHSWDEYSAWYLGLTEGAADETKARYAFVYGDLRRLHRMGLIACHYRAAEWGHKEVELAAHELLQYLDKARTK